MSGGALGEGHWYDDEAGPVVRPYAMTRGRTRSHAEERLDLIAVVVATDRMGTDLHSGRSAVDQTLSPEHIEIVERSRETPLSVAELAADLDLPVGVVRVLIGDLLDAGLVGVSRPVPPAELPDESILRDVIAGLRAL
ncbi:DUF742 domain-containing protein [Streptomyces zingiberis]|uniref:DUF742 domain-containing protein n=1 Tax=Streptomyces zingiberis TaxID=2053010 RepID=A0ABX1C4D1_9ACTN|nr:DUF742 domain-containing protein [Streptomyces zingiberis]NJQ03513.1 DUF742 domain-containing protein [Streptomyces zingiberis]